MTVTNGNTPTDDFTAELQAALNNQFANRGGNSPQPGEEESTASLPPPNTQDEVQGQGEGQVEGGDDGDLTQLPGYDPNVPDGSRPEIPATIDELLGEENEVGGGGEGGGESEQTPSVTTQQFVDLNAIAKQFYGQELTLEQATSLFQIANDLSMLDDEKRERLGEVLYGTPQPQAQPQTQQAPAVQSPQGYDYSPDDILKEVEEEFPEVAKALRAQQQLTNQQIADLTAWKTNWEQQQAEQQMAQFQSAVTTASNEWRQAHPEITPEEFVAISTRGGAGQYAQILVQQGHDPQTAIKMALDTAILTDPALKQKTIDAEVERREREVTSTLNKKRKAAAVSGTGGPATHEPPKLDPNDNEGRRALMREAVVSARTEGITTPPAS